MNEDLGSNRALQWIVAYDTAMFRLTEAEKERKALRKALEHIRDHDQDCQCDHDTEDCCSLQGDVTFCPRCFAAAALREQK